MARAEASHSSGDGAASLALGEILDPGRVALDVAAASKKRTLETVADLLADDDLSRDAIFDALLGRERLGSTGLGQGVALPHGRVPGNDRTRGAFLRLDGGVDFDAQDQQPVDLVFGLVVPEASTETHLQTLAAMARLFSDEAVCQQLRQAETAPEAHRLLVGGVD
ncbi:MAG: PTS sugar transporter subunit IIA [Thiohalospira sp.]